MNCFSEHYLTFLLQTKNRTSHDIFMEVTFLLAHTCRFSSELLCCPILGSCRYDFNGLELAHTFQFVIANKLSDKKIRFLSNSQLVRTILFSLQFLSMIKNRTVCVEHSIRERGWLCCNCRLSHKTIM